MNSYKITDCFFVDDSLAARLKLEVGWWFVLDDFASRIRIEEDEQVKLFLASGSSLNASVKRVSQSPAGNSAIQFDLFLENPSRVANQTVFSCKEIPNGTVLRK